MNILEIFTMLKTEDNVDNVYTVGFCDTLKGTSQVTNFFLLLILDLFAISISFLSVKGFLSRFLVMQMLFVANARKEILPSPPPPRPWS